MPITEPTTIADISEEEMESLPFDAIDHLECTRCGHEWEPNKHPKDYSRIGCPVNDCGHQAKSEIVVHTDESKLPDPEPEPEPETAESPSPRPGDSGGQDYRGPSRVETSGGMAAGPDDPPTKEPEMDLDFEAAFSTQTEMERDISFSTMSPGDFVNWFFREDMEEVSVRNSEILARKCDRGRRIPTQTQMGSILSSLDMNVGNETKQLWVAEAYWDRAKEYLSQNIGMDEGEIDQWVYQNDLDWVRVEQPKQPKPGETAGGTVGNPHTGQVESDGGVNQGVVGQPPAQQPQQGYQQQPQQGYQQQQPQQQQNSGMDPAMMKFMEKMFERQKDLETQIQKVATQGQGNQKQPTVQDRLKEMVQLKNAMSQLDDSGDSGEEVERMMQYFAGEIEELRNEMSEGGADQPAQGSDPMTGMAMTLAQRDDMDAEIVADMVTKMSGVESNPEVKKAEIEKEVEAMKMDQKKETVEEVFNGIEKVAETVTETGITSLLGDDGDSDEEFERVDDPPEGVERDVRQAQPVNQSQNGGGSTGDYRSDPTDFVQQAREESAMSMMDGEEEEEDERLPTFADEGGD